MKLYWLLIVPVLWAHSAVAQSSTLRLINENTYKGDTFTYILTDSATYNYSGGRSSNMKTGNHAYDTFALYQPAPKNRYIRTYDAANLILIHKRQQYKGGAWQDTTRFSYSYIAASMQYDTVLTEQWNGSTWVSDQLDRYRYSGGTQLDTIRHLKHDGGTWQEAAREIYLYNGGNMTEHRYEVWNDTLMQWDAWQQELYHYDAASRIDTYTVNRIDLLTLGLEPGTRKVYAYDGAGRVASHTYYRWFEPAMRWEGSEDHLYTYTTTGEIDMETINSWDFATQSWGPDRRKHYSYDLSGNLASVIEKRYVNFAFVNLFKQEWLYNSHDLPTIYRVFQWVGGGADYWRSYIGSPSQITYKYEEVPNDIAAIIKSDNLRLYPNPAAGFTNLQIEWQQALPFTIAIYDVQGRVVYYKSFAAARFFNSMLPLSGLAAGSYIIKAANSNEEMTKRLVIAGQ